MDPYGILQISPGASLNEVHEAYHKLAKRWHPDRFTGSEKQAAEMKFREVAEAYAAIKNQSVNNSFASPPTPAPAGSPPPGSGISPIEKKPADWLADAKNAISNRQYDTALAVSQYCFNFPQVAEEARLVYAMAVEASYKDVRAQTRAYEEVIRINPDNKVAVAKLAELYLAVNLPARAESMRAKAVKLGISLTPKQASADSATKQYAHGTKKPVQGSDSITDKILGFFKTGVKRGQ